MATSSLSMQIPYLRQLLGINFWKTIRCMGQERARGEACVCGYSAGVCVCVYITCVYKEKCVCMRDNMCVYEYEREYVCV